MKIKTSRFNTLLSLVILSKSLVPAGYMLAADTGLEAGASIYLSLCPIQNPSLNLEALYGTEVDNHVTHVHSADDLPSDSYRPISALGECALWQTAEAFADGSFACEVTPLTKLITSHVPVFSPRFFWFSFNAPRAPPSFLPLNNFFT